MGKEKMKKFKNEGYIHLTKTRIDEIDIEIIDGDRGKNYPRKEEFSETGHCLFLNTSNIKNDCFDLKKCDFISEKKDYLLNKGKLNRNDIVLTTRGTVGSLAFYSQFIPYNHLRINSGMVILRCGHNLCPQFIFHLFKSPFLKEQYRLFSSGSAQPQLPIKDLRKIKLFLPPLATQKKIAAVLSAYDDLIENNNRRIAILENMAQEIYREWFVRFRFPGYQKTTFHKGIPEGWDYHPCSQIFDIFSGGTPKTDVPYYWDGEIPFFTPRDCGDGFYVIDTEKSITGKGLTNCNSLLYKKNTIFITARGTVGKIVLNNKDMAMNQSCYALSPKNEAGIYFYFLSLRNSVNYIKGVSKSGVFDNIIKETFQIIPILTAPDAITKRFNSICKYKFEEISSLMLHNTLLKQTRDMLLNRLVSGKLEVDELDIHFPPSMEELDNNHEETF